MKNKLILMACGFLVLILIAVSLAQNPRSGTLNGNNTTPASVLTGVTTSDDTSQYFDKATLYDYARFTFKRVPKAVGSAINNDSSNVTFLMQGSHSGDFFAPLTFTIDSIHIEVLDTVYNAASGAIGTAGSSCVYDQFEGGTNIPWHRGFPYIRFILESQAATDDTVSYRILYDLSNKPK